MGDGSGISAGGRDLDPVRGGLLFLVLGLAIAGYGASDYRQQSAAVDAAVEVDATVVETSVESVSAGSSTSVDYRPAVTFEYAYDGEAYTSGSVFPSSLDPTYDTRSAAESVLSDYEAGERATAYVDPDSPGEGFLVNRESNTPLLAVGIGAVFALLGASKLRDGL